MPILLTRLDSAEQTLLVQECECFVGIDVDPTAHELAAEHLKQVQLPNTQISLLQGNFG